jgi:hypothetical protein
MMTEANAAKEKHFKIIVNGTEHTVESDVVTFEQVVAIAYPTPPTPDTIFSVTYEKAKKHPHDGDLVAGQSVEIKNGTEFDVTPTGRS